MKLTHDRLVTLFGLLVIFGIVLTVVWFGFFYPSTPARGQPYPGPGAISGKPTTPTPLSPRLPAASISTSTQDYLPVIAYSPPPCFTSPDGIGLERYYSYQSFRLSDRLNVLVNLWNGNLVAQFDEFVIPSRGLPLAFNHTYNNCANLVSANSGMNWTMNIAARVISSTSQVILYDGDGTRLVFAGNGSGIWNSPTGIFDTLTGTGPFTLTHKDQSQQIFTQNAATTWFLSRMQDRFGNALTLSYDGSNRVSNITAAGGQALTLTYNASSQLSQVTNDANQAFAFQYNGTFLTGITDPLSQTTIFTYTGTNLTSLADPRGVQTAFDYDAYQRLKTITISTTQMATFTYASGVTTFSDGNNHTATFYLNSTGQVTKTLDALGNPITFVYDTGYNLVQITNLLGRVSNTLYDGKGNVLSQTNALAQTTLYSYTAQNDLLSVVNAASHTTSYGYDSLGNLQLITDVLTNTTRYTSTTQGQRTAVRDANGNVTAYGYAGAGYLITTTDALGNLTRYGYDSIGNRVAVTDALTNVTLYRYDAANRLISTTVPLTVGLSATTLYGYDAVGNRSVLTDANGNVTTFGYDALNRQTRTTDALGNVTQSQYDNVGNRTKMIDANIHPVTYTYDVLNRLTNVTDSLSRVITYAYDAVGNRTGVTDARGNTTLTAFDPLNRVVSTTMPLTGTQTATTLYGYDAVGNRTVITDALTHTTTYVYDPLNRATNIIDAASHPITYTYDNVGNRLTQVDAAGNATRYGYDALNRVVTVTNPSLKSQSYSYDSVGNRTAFTDELTQTTRYAYDAAHRLVALTDPLTQTTSYGYDKVGNTLAITQPNNILTTFAYDNIYRATSKTNTRGTERYAYDNVGNALIITGTAGTTRNFTYDAINRVTVEEDRDTSQTTVVSYTFGYDPNSNLTSETENRPGKTPLTTTRAYDKANRMYAVTDPYNNTTGYAFDAAGNQTGVTDPSGYTTSVTPNSLNQPQTTFISSPSLGAIVTTTNTYNNRNLPTTAVTHDGPSNTTVTDTMDYNDNGFLKTKNVSNQGTSGNTVYSSVDYAYNNLANFITMTVGWPNSPYRKIIYDGDNRANCYLDEDGETLNHTWTYDDSGRRVRRDWSAGSACTQTGGRHWVYTYDGYRLLQENVTGDSVYTKTYSYDNEGNLSQIHLTLSSGSQLTYTYTWEPETHHLINVFADHGSYSDSWALGYDRFGRIIRICQDNSIACSQYTSFGYVGDSDWLSTLKNESGIRLTTFFYANGRPLGWWQAGSPPNEPSYYYRFNWHGDAGSPIPIGGDGSNIWIDWGAWGELGGSADYYSAWNGAWGYLHFSGFNSGTDYANGLYYVHGRWYNPDTGLFLSPDEKGEYLYGSGQDAVNNVWMALRGAGCRFADNELLGTVAFSDKLTEILTEGRARTWYGEQCVDYKDEGAFELGTHFGDVASVGVSIVEVQAGGGATALGLVGAPETGGTSLTVSGVGAAGVAHGTGVVTTVLVKNLVGIGQQVIAFAEGIGSGKGPHKVYVVKDENGKVIYVGRTKRLISQRELEHHLTPGRENWKLELREEGLGYDEARYWEQKLIDQNGGLEQLKNKIRAVAPGKWEILQVLFEDTP